MRRAVLAYLQRRGLARFELTGGAAPDVRDIERRRARGPGRAGVLGRDLAHLVNTVQGYFCPPAGVGLRVLAATEGPGAAGSVCV